MNSNLGDQRVRITIFRRDSLKLFLESLCPGRKNHFFLARRCRASRLALPAPYHSAHSFETSIPFGGK